MLFLQTEEERAMLSEGLKAPSFPTQALLHEPFEVASPLSIDNGIRGIDNAHTRFLDADREFNVLRDILRAVQPNTLEHLAPEGSSSSTDDVDCVHDRVGFLEVEGEEVLQVLDHTYEGLRVAYLHIAAGCHHMRISKASHKVLHSIAVNYTIGINGDDDVAMRQHNPCIESRSFSSICLIIVQDFGCILDPLHSPLVLSDEIPHNGIRVVSGPIIYHNNLQAMVTTLQQGLYC